MTDFYVQARNIHTYMFWFDYFVGKNKSILLTSIHGAHTAREEGVKQDVKKVNYKALPTRVFIALPRTINVDLIFFVETTVYIYFGRQWSISLCSACF